jgi:hypothetical protein
MTTAAFAVVLLSVIQSNKVEMRMNNIMKTAAAVGIAGAMALAGATPSMARDWHNYRNHSGWHNGAAVGAAAAGGLVAGAALGAAAATANGGYNYGNNYAYNGYYEGDAHTFHPGFNSNAQAGYNSYGYQPGYNSYGYQPGYNSYGSADFNDQPEGFGAAEGPSSFDTNNIGPNRERNIRATW